jgi:hypothetical protein
VIDKDDLVEENHEEAPCLSLEDDESIEDVANPQEENDDEESSHASIGNQDDFED